MKLSCENARSLVPSYLDGELSEEQAAPLRTHLFDCRLCREVAKEEKALKRWFVDSEVQMPPGFAARVTRLAFAGGGAEPDSAMPAAEPFPDAGFRREGTLLPFLLKLSAVAAAVLFVLAIAIRNETLPSGHGLEAQSAPPWERPGAEALPDLPAAAPAEGTDGTEADEEEPADPDRDR